MQVTGTAATAARAARTTEGQAFAVGVTADRKAPGLATLGLGAESAAVSLLADKRTRLQNQFANMETVLAGLQSQQQALGSLSTISTSSSSSSTKKSS